LSWLEAMWASFGNNTIFLGKWSIVGFNTVIIW
jgi:hypothetical protein